MKKIIVLILSVFIMFSCLNTPDIKENVKKDYICLYGDDEVHGGIPPCSLSDPSPSLELGSDKKGIWIK